MLFRSRHPSFSDAVTRARSARQLFLEQKLLRARKGAETTAAVFALKNAAPADWQDLRNVAHKHDIEVRRLTDAQLLAIASGVSPGDSNVIDGQCVVIDQG